MNVYQIWKEMIMTAGLAYYVGKGAGKLAEAFMRESGCSEAEAKEVRGLAAMATSGLAMIVTGDVAGAAATISEVINDNSKGPS